MKKVPFLIIILFSLNSCSPKFTTKPYIIRNYESNLLGSRDPDDGNKFKYELDVKSALSNVASDFGKYDYNIVWNDTKIIVRCRKSRITEIDKFLDNFK